MPSWNEQERLKALESYGILDTPKEDDFEDIAKMASRICKAPISVITLVAGNRQWFKAEVGLGVRETPLDVSICAKAILQPGVFTVSDLTKDSRFEDNPLVKGKPDLRFYAGALLETPDGLPLGTMCVLDYKPRVLTEDEADTLKSLARQVMAQLELRRALNAKSKSEERLNLALNASGFVGIWEWDILNDRVYADPRFVSIFGGEPSWSVEGAPIADYVKAIHPDDFGRIQIAIEKALQSGGLFFEEYRLVQKDGSVRWIEARGQCYYDENKKPIRFPGVAVDITAGKASERQAIEGAERYRFLTESMPHKVSTANAKGELTFVNREWTEYTGLTMEQLRDSGWGEWVHPDDVEERLRRWKESVAQTKPFEMEYRLRRKDGVYRWHHAKALPMLGADGELRMWIGSNADIDERHEAQWRADFLSQLTQRLSLISSPDELNRVATRELGRFLHGNRCYFFEAIQPEIHTRVLPDWCKPDEESLQGEYDLAVFGVPEMWETLRSKSVALNDTSLHPWTVPFLKNYQAMNIGAALIAPFSRDGKWVCCLGVSSKEARQWQPEEQALLENVMLRVWPLIERARIEVELRASEERFRAMSDNIAPLAWMARNDGFVFWYNKRWYDYTGETLEAMQGEGWSKVQDPEHLPHVLESWKKAVAEGHPWEDTFPLRGVNGEFRWFLSRAYPIRDAEGKITLWFGVNTDITDLRAAQNSLREANSLLGSRAAQLESLVQQRTQKLSDTIGELEAFSYSISHDMRAPLRSMIGFSEILKEEYAPKLDEMGVNYLNRISNASRRMDHLIQDVLVFSRISRQDVVLETVDCDKLIREIIQSYPNLHADTVDISIKSALPAVKGNESLLTQCFSNLLENGAKFVNKGSKARVEVWSEVENGRVRLCFQDEGIGISEQHLERIFDIFQRVGRDNDGTGIGLAIVRKAVEKMGGTMGVKSELGKGSLFWLDLEPV